MKEHNRLTYTGLASVIALALVSPALAQDDTGASPQAGGLGDIIVTAQRHEESAQRAAVILDTVTAEELRGISDVRQLQSAVPGMQFANAGNTIQTYVRGIGSFNAKSVQESAVAFSLDGVYLFTTTQVSPAMYDLARIEVLKGPQGTLYGRNASGGAINLISQGAKLGDIEGYVSGEVGNYDLIRMVAAVNVPLSSTFAVRIAGQHVEHDGYLSDGTSDDDTTSGRIRALWEPSADISVKLNFDAARVRSVGPGSVVFPFVDPDNPWIGALDPRLAAAGFPVSGIPPLTTPHNELDQWSASAQLDWNMGFATLTLLPAYRDEEISQRSYVPGYGFFEDAKVEHKSFEARLANQTDRLRWVVGAYYLDVDIEQTQQVNNPTPVAGVPNINDVNNPNKLESWAVFGEATFGLTDSLRLIGGLRYTWEKSVSGGFQNQIFPASVATDAFQPGIEPGDFIIDKRVSDDAITWKVGVQYDVAPDSMLFATVSRGFKGGGSFVDSAAADPVFEPEFVTAYELGSRNRFFNNSLQVNLEAFYWEIKDQQVAFVGFNSLNQAKFQTTNAANSTVYGASADIVWLMTPNDRFHFGVEYLHTEYDEFVRIQPVAPLGTTCPVTLLNPGPPPRRAIDCSGFPMMRSPKWAGSAGYEHRFDLSNGGDITVSGDMTFASSRWTSIDFSPVTKDPGYAIFNADITYTAPDERWSVSLWGKNLAKEEFLMGGIQSGTFNRPTINQPRTYGVRARVNF